ncbi:hypothetical protein BDW74DRAFT_173014 [Aspergillus multicolor]|uniref:uncharacterized protein n=1 Tax=Aspergillus multicolor TaxID=41759 RepID=UPI003CCDC721
MLDKERNSLSVDLFLDGALHDPSPGQNISPSALRDVAVQCPQLFNSFLKIRPDNDALQEVLAPSVQVRDTKLHKNVQLSVALLGNKTSEALGIPLRLNSLTVRDWQLKELSQSYVLDYGRPSILTNFGLKPIKWFRKLSFNGPDSRRCTFAEGDCIKYRDNQNGKVLAFFIHELTDRSRRAFAVLYPMDAHTPDRDQVLDLPLLRISKKRVIVGLGGLAVTSNYLVPLGGTPLTATQPGLQITDDVFILCD